MKFTNYAAVAVLLASAVLATETQKSLIDTSGSGAGLDGVVEVPVPSTPGAQPGAQPGASTPVKSEDEAAARIKSEDEAARKKAQVEAALKEATEEVNTAENVLEKAQKALEKTDLSDEAKTKAARDDVETAKKTLETAKKTLETAKLKLAEDLKEVKVTVRNPQAQISDPSGTSDKTSFLQNPWVIGGGIALAILVLGGGIYAFTSSSKDETDL